MKRVSAIGWTFLALLFSSLAAQAQSNPNRVAILGWYPANLSARFSVGGGPEGVAFDGSSIWVANVNRNTVTKLRASDGAQEGTFKVGSGPFALAFDGANIWVANESSDNVTKLEASNGVVLGTFAGGNSPEGIAFDGSSVWVANF